MDSEEAARAYLAKHTSGEPSDYRAYRFPHGWVCTKIVSGPMAGLGMSQLVVESETGKIYQYPSWSQQMVAEQHEQSLATQTNPSGRQIYPPLHKLSARLLNESPPTVEYELTIQSLENPPAAPERQHRLTLEIDSYRFAPTDSLSAVASSKIRWKRDQDGGTWPQTLEIFE